MLWRLAFVPVVVGSLRSWKKNFLNCNWYIVPVRLTKIIAIWRTYGEMIPVHNCWQNFFLETCCFLRFWLAIPIAGVIVISSPTHQTNPTLQEYSENHILYYYRIVSQEEILTGVLFYPHPVSETQLCSDTQLRSYTLFIRPTSIFTDTMLSSKIAKNNNPTCSSRALLVLLLLSTTLLSPQAGPVDRGKERLINGATPKNAAVPAVRASRLGVVHDAPSAARVEQTGGRAAARSTTSSRGAPPPPQRPKRSVWGNGMPSFADVVAGVGHVVQGVAQGVGCNSGGRTTVPEGRTAAVGKTGAPAPAGKEGGTTTSKSGASTSGKDAARSASRPRPGPPPSGRSPAARTPTPAPAPAEKDRELSPSSTVLTGDPPTNSGSSTGTWSSTGTGASNSAPSSPPQELEGGSPPQELNADDWSTEVVDVLPAPWGASPPPGAQEGWRWSSTEASLDDVSASGTTTTISPTDVCERPPLPPMPAEPAPPMLPARGHGRPLAPMPDGPPPPAPPSFPPQLVAVGLLTSTPSRTDATGLRPRRGWSSKRSLERSSQIGKGAAPRRTALRSEVPRSLPRTLPRAVLFRPRAPPGVP